MYWSQNGANHRPTDTQIPVETEGKRQYLCPMKMVEHQFQNVREEDQKASSIGFVCDQDVNHKLIREKV